MQTNRGAPTPPIAFGDGAITDHIEAKRVEIGAGLRTVLEATGAEVIDAPDVIAGTITGFVRTLAVAR